MLNYLRCNYVVFACLWFVVGCAKTHVIYVTPSPALTQVVKAGDTIKWQATEFGEPDFFVHFVDGNNPCVMATTPKPLFLKSVNGVAECTLDKSIDLQQFKYAIDHVDPEKSKEVANPKPCGGCTVTPTVGPKSCGPCAKVEKGVGTPVADGDPDGSIQMTCDPKANPAITALPPANPGDTIYWTPKNVPDPNMDGWKVTYPYVSGQTPVSLCTNNLTQFDSNHSSCQLASGQLPPQSAFSVTTGSCTTSQTFTLQGPSK